MKACCDSNLNLGRDLKKVFTEALIRSISQHCGMPIWRSVVLFVKDWAGSWRKLACCCTVIEGVVLNNWVNVLPQHSPQYPNHVCELWTTLNCNWITWNGVHNYCNGRWIPLLSVLLFCSAHVGPMDGARQFVSRSVVMICVTVVGRCSRILANDQNEVNITRGRGEFWMQTDNIGVLSLLCINWQWEVILVRRVMTRDDSSQKCNVCGDLCLMHIA